jgi:hypothetical protein
MIEALAEQWWLIGLLQQKTLRVRPKGPSLARLLVSRGQSPRPGLLRRALPGFRSRTRLP